jgi:hypothetical protein
MVLEDCKKQPLGRGNFGNTFEYSSPTGSGVDADLPDKVTVKQVLKSQGSELSENERQQILSVRHEK